MDRISWASLRTRLTAFASIIGWHRRHIRDAVILTGIVTAAFAIFDLGDLFLKIADLAKDYEEWGADDVLVMSFVLSIALTIFCYRRTQDLVAEVKGAPCCRTGSPAACAT
jgi:hypothetical protein